MTEGKRGFDLGTLLMVLILLCILVAGLWMTGKALDARFDVLDTKLTAATDQIRADVSELRNAVLAVRTERARTAPAEDQETPAGKAK